ncbi:MAG: hypothetical protein BGO21_17615 [Dyadobacter sp. 50-39]|uniref:MFS transporter n=1 Tax=Dyadobacter sp. 50-39 TaxID=1895756 RepID=UPI00095AA7F6|nr:MFS transporter [Dyadobacter sp. 50-39]OJV14538.1 MAG: hypothetical protein BGO21_17615 [Dyadobacter sp. 50-39]
MIQTADISRLLNVRDDEKQLVKLLMLFSFFMGGAIALFYTVVASSFLTSFERTALPEVYVVGGVFVYLLGIGLSWLQKRLRFDKLGEMALALLTASIVLMLVCYQFTGSKWVFYVLFIWNRVFVLVNGLTFWAVVVKVFSFQQSKRLSSLINTGDVFASVAMYLAVPALVKVVPTDYLLVISVAFLAVCSVLLRKIHRDYVTPAHLTDRRVREEKSADAPVNPAYYRSIFLLALLPVFGLFFVDYLFFTESRAVFPNKEALASFLGVFFGVSAILEFFIKTFLYNKLIGRFGLAMGIMLLPVLLVFSLTVSVIYGLAYDTAGIFFACIALSRFFMSAVRKAISEPAYQTLYQPITARLRLFIQGRIEGRAKAVGGFAAGVMLFILVNVAGMDALRLSMLFLVAALCWAVVALLGQRLYKKVVMEKVFRFAIPAQGRHTYEPAAAPAELPFRKITDRVFSKHNTERIEAALALGRADRFLAYKSLIPLLQDPDPDVRHAAIFVAGEMKRPELWPYLTEQMELDRYYAVAFDALVKSGTPLLKYIEKSFLSNNENRFRQLHLLNLAEKIGGPEAIRFFRRNLDNPSRFVKDKVAVSLRNLHYRANSTEQSLLFNELDDHLATFSWLLAAHSDLGKAYARDSQLIINLEKEQRRIILKAFTLLEVLYGPRFHAVTLLDGDQATDARDYLTEISDLLLPEAVKSKILPYLDSASFHEMRMRYDELFPQARLSVEERLKDIVNKDYTRISRWTKAVAIKELKGYPAESVTDILVSNAVSRSTVISETAFYVLRIVNPARFRSLLEVMTRTDDQFHLRIMQPLEWLATENDLLICKLRRLRESPPLHHLLNGELQKILLNSAYFKEEANEVIDLRKHVNHNNMSVLVTYGKLLFSKAGIVQSGEILSVTEIRDAGSVMIPNVLEDSEFYIVENYLLQDLNVTRPAVAQTA